MKRILQAIFILILLAGGAFFGMLFLRTAVQRPIFEGELVGTGISIPVSIADTAEERIQGLSGTSSLPVGTGTLFMFESSDKYGFWMKDMQYPIDIVWIDEEMNVIEITPAVAPDTYPNVFYPQVPVRYVLELNANEAQYLQLHTGVHLELKRN